jgi:DNA polymerase-1
MKPRTTAALDLFHDGARALAQVEAVGMRVDVGYLQGAIERTERRIARMLRRLQTAKEVRIWKRVFGSKTNLTSNEQLGRVLFDEMGIESTERTKTGKWKTGEEELENVDTPFVRDWLMIKKLQKAVSTNLKGLLREVVDGVVHPIYNLNLVQTYRGSCDSPNLQNQPIRDPELGKLIRPAFIARPGRRLVELDYGGIEVRVAACYHKDPRMLDYIADPTKDLHRDMAVECFMLRPEQVTKDIRYCGKNQFVFPQFYGDWYIDCARSMWAWIGRRKLVTADGTDLYTHLRSKGIKRLGACDPKEDPIPGMFEHHIRQVERRFWEKRFAVYGNWKRKWYESYCKRGRFETLTGFVCQGVLKRNQVINFPVQGSAFHCLLWSLNRLVLYELRRAKMKAKIVGQIHDSLIGDVPDEEVSDYVALCERVMTKDLPKLWKWIIVPLTVEAEATPVNGNWSEKQKVG